MRHYITTKRDLRNWVDTATSGWGERSDTDVDTITDAIQSADHPAWGTDWTDYLDSLPELTEYVKDETTVAGCQIQTDRSGQGHAWKNIDRDDIPEHIVLEIEGEIIDGGKESCADFVASNGLHYRW